MCASGVLIGSAVVPIASCLMWSKANKYGAIAGAFIGQWSGLTMWLVRALPVCGPPYLTADAHTPLLQTRGRTQPSWQDPTFMHRQRAGRTNQPEVAFQV